MVPTATERILQARAALLLVDAALDDALRAGFAPGSWCADQVEDAASNVEAARRRLDVLARVSMADSGGQWRGDGNRAA